MAAQLLRQARKAAGLTQAELARRAGTSQPVISAYERDRRDPSVSTLQRIVRAAGAQLRLGYGFVAANGALPRAVDDEERSDRLVDVLLLADAIPTRPRRELTFPRISSS